jgi:hypothetical protein
LRISFLFRNWRAQSKEQDFEDRDIGGILGDGVSSIVSQLRFAVGHFSWPAAAAPTSIPDFLFCSAEPPSVWSDTR